MNSIRGGRLYASLVRAVALLWSFSAPGGTACGAELRVLLFAPDGAPIERGEVEVHQRDGSSTIYRNPTTQGDGSRFELPPGEYSLIAGAQGFEPYHGEITIGLGPRLVRLGLPSAVEADVAALRGKVIRSSEDTRNLWVDVQPVYEVDWTLLTLNNTAVKSDGSFTFADIQPGLYTLLLFGDRTVPEDTEFYAAPYELLHAQVVRVNGETKVELRVDPAAEPTLRIP